MRGAEIARHDIARPEKLTTQERKGCAVVTIVGTAAAQRCAAPNRVFLYVSK